MKQIDTVAITKDAQARWRFLEDFVGFSDQDWLSIQESISPLANKLPSILDAVYDHLLSYDDTRRVFFGPHEEVDPEYLAIRKEHLTEWLFRSIQGIDNRGDLARYLMEVGRRHTGVAGEPDRVVPPRYMVGLMSFIQSQIISNLFDALPGDPERLRRLVLAWNKMLMIQLELFLKAMAPQWPGWDEEITKTS
jgi:hypothetical protein